MNHISPIITYLKNKNLILGQGQGLLCATYATNLAFFWSYLMVQQLKVFM